MTTQGSNSTRLRRLNERAVLNAVRSRGELSIADVSRLTKLTPPAVSTIVKTLDSAGYLEVKTVRTGNVGSPSALYGLKQNGAFSLGLHIGRRAMNSLLMDFAGQPVASLDEEYEFPQFAMISKQALEHIGRLTNQLEREAQGRIVGLGVAIPHLFGFWGEELGFPEDVNQDWERNSILEYLSRTLQLPILSENDSTSAALAELHCGIGRHTKNFFHVYINTFIGGGLVLDGRLVRGPQGLAATFGPYPVTYSRLSSVKPSSRSFEYLFRRASVFTLMRHVQAGGVALRQVGLLERPDPLWDSLVDEWIADAADALAQSILGTVSVIDVEAIVIDGTLPPRIRHALIEKVRAEVREHAGEVIVVPDIVEGELGSSATSLGAALLPMYERFWLSEVPLGAE